MAKKTENVVYDRLSLEQWREAVAENPDLSVEVFTNGHSMRPLLRVRGDSVKLVQFKREMVIGDIILFLRADGKQIIHRLCWMDEENVQTIGDNCDRKDAVVPRSSVVGLVTHVSNRGHLIHVDTRLGRFYGKFMIWSNPVRMFIRNKMYYPLRKLAKRIIKGK